MRQNLIASNSTIDLTDEDDPRPQRSAQNNPPALVALNVKNRAQLVQTQTPPVQRHVVTTQQPMRAAQVVTTTRKLAVLGKIFEILVFIRRKIQNKINDTLL